MKISDFTKLAKSAQATLKALDHPAEHIYLVGYSEPKVIPSLLFVSSKYNGLNVYDRAQLATAIQAGPLKYNFHILGTNQLGKSNSLISRDMLYNAVKLYGRQPLMMDDLEYATKQDMNFSGHDRAPIVV